MKRNFICGLILIFALMPAYASIKVYNDLSDQQQKIWFTGTAHGKEIKVNPGTENFPIPTGYYGEGTFTHEKTHDDDIKIKFYVIPDATQGSHLFADCTFKPNVKSGVGIKSSCSITSDYQLKSTGTTYAKDGPTFISELKIHVSNKK